MENNLKGEQAVMNSPDIKPNYAALGSKYYVNGIIYLPDGVWLVW